MARRRGCLVTRIFHDDRTELWCGDYRTVGIERSPGVAAHQLAVHVIIDPPYDETTHKNARTNDGSGHGTKLGIDFAAFDDEQMRQFSEWCYATANGWILIFCAVEQVGPWKAALEAAGCRWMRAQAWVKVAPTPQFTGDRPGQWGECIATAWAGKSKHRRADPEWNGGGVAGVYHYAAQEPGITRVHPTQKPILLMRNLVSLFTNPHDLVLDPFAGSGTTLRAARDLGRLAVGCELREDYAREAAARLGDLSCIDSKSQLPLFG